MLALWSLGFAQHHSLVTVRVNGEQRKLPSRCDTPCFKIDQPQVAVGCDDSGHHRPTPDSPRTANSGPIDPGPAVYALQLRSLEERAKMEAVDGASKGS